MRGTSTDRRRQRDLGSGAGRERPIGRHHQRVERFRGGGQNGHLGRIGSCYWRCYVLAFANMKHHSDLYAVDFPTLRLKHEGGVIVSLGLSIYPGEESKISCSQPKLVQGRRGKQCLRGGTLSTAFSFVGSRGGTSMIERTALPDRNGMTYWVALSAACLDPRGFTARTFYIGIYNSRKYMVTANRPQERPDQFRSSGSKPTV